jgi:hypothetical protein
MNQDARDNFQQAASAPRTSLIGDIWQFMRRNKKWWLMPIVMVFLLLGLLMVLGGTAAAPFIYTLF